MSFRINAVEDLARIAGIGKEHFVTWGTGRWNYSLLEYIEKREVVLLVSGLGMHRVEWNAELIERLHREGYATLAIDNHDAGLSHRGASADAYSLRDLALDLIGVLDALAIDRVHVVGISMGGMIAQHIALAAPERVITLTSLSSTTSARGVGRPAEEAKWIFTTQMPRERGDYLSYVERHHLSITTPSHRDIPRALDIGEAVWERGLNAAGMERQLAAIREDGDRTERLAEVSAPTLVVHGDTDPMIDLSGGQATASAIPGARFVTVPRMGHVITWHSADFVADELVTHFRS